MSTNCLATLGRLFCKKPGITASRDEDVEWINQIQFQDLDTQELKGVINSAAGDQLALNELLLVAVSQWNAAAVELLLETGAQCDADEQHISGIDIDKKTSSIIDY